jgi:hypothetical protein
MRFSQEMPSITLALSENRRAVEGARFERGARVT